MKKALNRGCLPPGMSIREVIEVSARLGADGLELGVSDRGELTPETSDQDLAEIARLAKQVGLELHSVLAGFLWRNPLTSGDAEARARSFAMARRSIQIAKLLGADTMLLIPGAVTANDPYDVVWDRALAAVRELATYAGELGVRLGIENVANEFLLSPLEMRAFIDAVGSPWVGAYYDIGNTVLLHQGRPEQWIRILGHRIFKIHVKDWRATEPMYLSSMMSVPLLAGNTVDWPAAFSALRAIGYDDYVTAELRYYDYHPTQLARDTIESLSALISGEVEDFSRAKPS